MGNQGYPNISVTQDNTTSGATVTFNALSEEVTAMLSVNATGTATVTWRDLAAGTLASIVLEPGDSHRFPLKSKSVVYTKTVNADRLTLAALW